MAGVEHDSEVQINEKNRVSGSVGTHCLFDENLLANRKEKRRDDVVVIRNYVLQITMVRKRKVAMNCKKS
jgi:hypothetical protein